MQHLAKLSLEELESEMESSHEKVGYCLRQIKDRGLWSEHGFNSFESYCEDRWGYKKTHVYRLLDYVKVVDVLRADGVTFIPSEGQMRPALQGKRFAKNEESFIDTAASSVKIAIDTCPVKNDIPQLTAKHVESVQQQFGGTGRRSTPKVNPVVTELKDLFKRLRHTELYRVGDADKFIKKHGMDGFPEDFADIADLFNDCAALLVR